MNICFFLTRVENITFKYIGKLIYIYIYAQGIPFNVLPWFHHCNVLRSSVACAVSITNHYRIHFTNIGISNYHHYIDEYQSFNTALLFGMIYSCYNLWESISELHGPQLSICVIAAIKSTGLIYPNMGTGLARYFFSLLQITRHQFGAP